VKEDRMITRARRALALGLALAATLLPALIMVVDGGAKRWR
jgi:hypothetical protein